MPLFGACWRASELGWPACLFSDCGRRQACASALSNISVQAGAIEMRAGQRQVAAVLAKIREQLEPAGTYPPGAGRSVGLDAPDARSLADGLAGGSSA